MRKIHHCHVELYRRHMLRNMPGWAQTTVRVQREESIPDLANACVNANSDRKRRDRPVDAASTLIGLVKMIRRQGKDILSWLEVVAAAPGCAIDPHLRARYARKWANRIKKQRNLCT